MICCIGAQGCQARVHTDAMSENSSLVCVSDYEKRALELLCQNARDYYKSGANDGQTLLNNVDDFMR